MSMLVINLDPKEGPVHEDAKLAFYKLVKAGLEALQGAPNFWTTRVVHPSDAGCNWEYEFRTSSRETHLSFGKMGPELLFNMGRMLENALQNDIDQVVVKRSDGAMTYITRVLNQNSRIIALHFASGR